MGTESSITWIETATLNQWRPPRGATAAEREPASVKDCGPSATHQQVNTVDSPSTKHRTDPATQNRTGATHQVAVRT